MYNVVEHENEFMVDDISLPYWADLISLWLEDENI